MASGRNLNEIMRSFTSRVNPHLLVALAIALAYHGSLLFFTFKRTYDAYVHIFFADHYARAWFDHWDYRWYTGFTLTSYPPGSQQSIALLSSIFGLQNSFIIVQTIAVLIVTIGIYRFSKIWVSERAAGYAALLTVFASSITETIHVFGQLPTTFSLGFLLNALPYAKRWLDEGDPKILLTAWALNAATTAGHHVTTLFGAVFFVAPVIGLAIVEKFRTPLPDEPSAHPGKVTRVNLKPLVVRRLRRIVPVAMRAMLYGVGLGMILLFVVLPYWLWSKDDPIAQVPIPHASRDSFILNPNAGLVFWLIPYGIALIALPYVFYKGFTTKAWPMALSLTAMFILGTGGTTPIPKLLLRGAFDVLTLDRFTFWCTILMLPLLGEFVDSLIRGRLARYLQEQFGYFFWRFTQVALIVSYIGFSVFTANLTQFRKFQPAPIEAQPIVNFLEKDEHWRWRFLTLGFGDQMAWLSAQTTATSVDGNYHSARRLPELTTTPVERLEGAKYRGIPGIGSLQQFLAVPEKYNLKFTFSNDPFYDPLLYFSGWHKLQRLENGIDVWEREDIPPLPEVLPRKEIPIYQRVMWGIVPMSAIALAAIAVSAKLWWPLLKRLLAFLGITKRARWLASHSPIKPTRNMVRSWWQCFDAMLLKHSGLPEDDNSRAITWKPWQILLKRLKWPKPAAPSARSIRTGIIIGAMVAVLAGGAAAFMRGSRSPTSIIEAYYDDLDFRRFYSAYSRLDPQTRPSFDQYMLELSVKNGLVASYGKLDSVRSTVIETTASTARVEAKLDWITALNTYPDTAIHDMVQHGGQWYITPQKSDLRIPPDQFFRYPEVAFGSQGRRRITAGPTDMSDVQDRPQLQILSAKLVKADDRTSVVGELMNTDSDPADITLSAYLYDGAGSIMTWYNAQQVIAHKILPKTVTPFRVDFEGVAGIALSSTVPVLDFKPGDFTPIALMQTISAFDVFAKAVVTPRVSKPNLTVQNVRVIVDEDGNHAIAGELLNNGSIEATIPQLLLTLYDDAGDVAWVDMLYVENAVRPQRAEPFVIPIKPPEHIKTLMQKGNLFDNTLSAGVQRDNTWAERIPLPRDTGYAAARITVNPMMSGASQ